MLTGHINIDNSELMKKCIELSKKTNPHSGGTFTGVKHSLCSAIKDPSVNPHTWTEFQSVIDNLKTLIDPTEITKSWFNITMTGGVMNEHMHFQAPHSVLLYYINSNTDHPHIEFLINGEWVKKECVSGDWIIFPKLLPHRVPVNNGTGDRISVSVNIGKPKLI